MSVLKRYAPKEKIMKYALIFVFAATSVFAADASPTVTLTQPEVSAIINAEASKAIANFAVQQEAAKAKDAYTKVNAAFAPKPTVRP